MVKNLSIVWNCHLKETLFRKFSVNCTMGPGVMGHGQVMVELTGDEEI